MKLDIKSGTTIAAVVASAATLGGLVAVASPATAGDTWSCKSGYYCLYEDRNYENQESKNQAYQAFSGLMNDRDSSAVNKVTTTAMVVVFYDRNYTGGQVWCLRAGTARPTLSPEDKGSSAALWPNKANSLC